MKKAKIVNGIDYKPLTKQVQLSTVKYATVNSKTK